MMSNSQEDNYEHIKALVRDLHMTRNVARPEHLVDTPASRNHHMASAVTTCQQHVSHAQKLVVHQLGMSDDGPNRATIDCTAFYIEEEDETSDTNTSSLDISMVVPTTNQNSKRNHNHTNHFHGKGCNTLDANFTIPSVVITDVNEPIDLITSTQRRFSQLYSGLRRFSTSHTVGMASKIPNTNTHINTDPPPHKMRSATCDRALCVV